MAAATGPSIEIDRDEWSLFHALLAASAEFSPEYGAACRADRLEARVRGARKLAFLLDKASPAPSDPRLYRAVVPRTDPPVPRHIAGETERARFVPAIQRAFGGNPDVRPDATTGVYSLYSPAGEFAANPILALILELQNNRPVWEEAIAQGVFVYTETDISNNIPAAIRNGLARFDPGTHGGQPVVGPRINPDDDGWCMYNSILAGFANYHNSIVAKSPTDRETRAKNARKFAFLIAQIALKNPATVGRIQAAIITADGGEPIVYPAGYVRNPIHEPEYGYPTLIDETNPALPHIVFLGLPRKYVIRAEDFLKGLYSLPPGATSAVSGPQIWGDYTLLKDTIYDMLHGLGVGLRVRESDGSIIPPELNLPPPAGSTTFITLQQDTIHYQLLAPPNPPVNRDPIQSMEHMFLTVYGSDAHIAAEALYGGVYDRSELGKISQVSPLIAALAAPAVVRPTVAPTLHNAAAGLVHLVGNLARHIDSKMDLVPAAAGILGTVGTAASAIRGGPVGAPGSLGAAVGAAAAAPSGGVSGAGASTLGAGMSAAAISLGPAANPATRATTLRAAADALKAAAIANPARKAEADAAEAAAVAAEAEAARVLARPGSPKTPAEAATKAKNLRDIATALRTLADADPTRKAEADAAEAAAVAAENEAARLTAPADRDAKQKKAIAAEAHAARLNAAAAAAEKEAATLNASATRAEAEATRLEKVAADAQARVVAIRAAGGSPSDIAAAQAFANGADDAAAAARDEATRLRTAANVASQVAFSTRAAATEAHSAAITARVESGTTAPSSGVCPQDADEATPNWASTILTEPIPDKCLTAPFLTPDCIAKGIQHSASVADKHAAARAALSRANIAKYDEDPLVQPATDPGPLTGGKMSRWVQLSDKYPDRRIKVRNPTTGRIEEFAVSNPYRAKRYRDKILGVNGMPASFANPTGAAMAVISDPSGDNHPEDESMMRQNALLLKKIAPPELVSNNKMAVALLESLWFCGASANVASDPRCFPARALGELREYQATKTQQQQAALAKAAMETSSWTLLKRSMGTFLGPFTAALPNLTPKAKPIASPAATLPALPPGFDMFRTYLERHTQTLQAEIDDLRQQLSRIGATPAKPSAEPEETSASPAAGSPAAPPSPVGSALAAAAAAAPGGITPLVPIPSAAAAAAAKPAAAVDIAKSGGIPMPPVLPFGVRVPAPTSGAAPMAMRGRFRRLDL